MALWLPGRDRCVWHLQRTGGGEAPHGIRFPITTHHWNSRWWRTGWCRQATPARAWRWPPSSGDGGSVRRQLEHKETQDTTGSDLHVGTGWPQVGRFTLPASVRSVPTVRRLNTRRSSSSRAISPQKAAERKHTGEEINTTLKVNQKEIPQDESCKE